MRIYLVFLIGFLKRIYSLEWQTFFFVKITEIPRQKRFVRVVGENYVPQLSNYTHVTIPSVSSYVTQNKGLFHYLKQTSDLHWNISGLNKKYW